MSITKIHIAFIFIISLIAVSVLTVGSAYAADIASPKITKISVSQAYQVNKETYGYKPLKSKKTYGIATRKYARWDSNHVSISFSDSNTFDRNYYLERSTSPNSGFKEIEPYEGDIPNVLVDEDTERGKTYFYRLVGEYFCDNGLVRKTSNVVSTTTSPKTLKIKSAKFKTPTGWKTYIRTKKIIKSKKTTFKISWNKRSDVDGYYVYRVKTTRMPLRKINKSYLYVVSDSGFGGGGSPGDYYYNAANTKTLKKVAALKKSATAYTVKLSNKTLRRYSPTTYYYAVVPYIKQNGKVYIGDCNNAYVPYTVSPNTGSGDMITRTDFGFNIIFPFPLM